MSGSISLLLMLLGIGLLSIGVVGLDIDSDGSWASVALGSK